MTKKYFDEVIRRYRKMNKLDPGWDHNDLKHLNFILDNWALHLSDDNDIALLRDCVSRKDWKGLNNYYYQCTRFSIFPIFVRFDFTAWEWRTLLDS